MDTKRTGKVSGALGGKVFYYSKEIHDEDGRELARKRAAHQKKKLSKNPQKSRPLLPYHREEAGKQVLTAVQDFLFPDGRFCGAPLFEGDRRVAS